MAAFTGFSERFKADLDCFLVSGFGRGSQFLGRFPYIGRMLAELCPPCPYLGLGPGIFSKAPWGKKIKNLIHILQNDFDLDLDLGKIFLLHRLVMALATALLLLSISFRLRTIASGASPPIRRSETTTKITAPSFVFLPINTLTTGILIDLIINRVYRLQVIRNSQRILPRHIFVS